MQADNNQESTAQGSGMGMTQEQMQASFQQM